MSINTDVQLEMGVKGSKLMPKSKSVKEIMPVEVFDKISRVITPGNVSPTLFLCRTYLEQLE